jgi:hypothetical protein
MIEVVGGTGAVYKPLLRENCQHLLHVVAAELLLLRERQLESGALHVIDEDVQVVRIDQRALRRRVEEIGRVPDDELIEGRTARHHHGRGAAGAPPGSAGPLPR